MRLQLDSALNRTEIGQTGGVGASNADSRRTGSGALGAQDSIQISGASSALNSLNADRAARIQQLTSAVQSGTYNLSSSLIAGAMVNHATS